MYSRTIRLFPFRDLLNETSVIDKFGESALHHAARMGDLEVVTKVLEEGADVTANVCILFLFRIKLNNV